MSVNCYLTTICQTGPAYVTFEPDFTWDAIAVSEAPVNLEQFRYEFTPFPDAVFFTGAYESDVHDSPRPSLYKTAVYFEINQAWLVIDGELVSSPRPWSPEQRIVLQREHKLVRLFIAGVEQARHVYE